MTMGEQSFRGAHAPRVLISAPRQNLPVIPKMRWARAPIAARDSACAPQKDTSGARGFFQR
jgi:hypothetical protein